MKELKIEQMESLSGGRSLWGCVGQVASGMEVLGTLAAVGIFTMTPLGWGFLALCSVSLIASVIDNPTACD